MPKLGWSDKVYHIIAFSGLSFLLCWAVPSRLGQRFRQLGVAGGIALAYAGFDEFTQQFIPGRHCDIWDVAADAVGICVGISCYLSCHWLLTQVTWGRRLIASFSR